MIVLWAALMAGLSGDAVVKKLEGESVTHATILEPVLAVTTGETKMTRARFHDILRKLCGSDLPLAKIAVLRASDTATYAGYEFQAVDPKAISDHENMAVTCRAVSGPDGAAILSAGTRRWPY